MNIPKFLIADNSEFPEDLYVIHTEYPRFILNVDSEDVEWLDDVNQEENMETEVSNLIEQAFEFLEYEIDSYDEDGEEE